MHSFLLYVLPPNFLPMSLQLMKLHCAAREDVIRVRRWVSDSHSRRLVRAESMEGPEPSQRAVNSLTAVGPFIATCLLTGCAQRTLQLINFAENVDICRHIVSAQNAKSVCYPFVELLQSPFAGTLGSRLTPLTLRSRESTAMGCVM